MEVFDEKLQITMSPDTFVYYLYFTCEINAVLLPADTLAFLCAGQTNLAGHLGVIDSRMDQNYDCVRL